MDMDSDVLTSLKSVSTYSQLLLDVFNCGLQRSGPLSGFILYCLHRLQEGRHVRHHHLEQPGHIIRLWTD